MKKTTKQESVLRGKGRNIVKEEEEDESPRSNALALQSEISKEGTNPSKREKNFLLDDLEFEVDEPISQLKKDLERLAAEEDDSEEAFQRELEQYKLPQEAQRQITSANKDIESNQSLSSRIRSELEQYVNIMEEKTSDIDGEKLIRIPRNFQTIVNAMTKEDLFDGEEGFSEVDNGKSKSKGSDAKANQQQRPPLPNKASGAAGKFLNHQQLKKDNRQAWYRYLMEDYINRDMNDEHDGRYSTLLINSSEEEKVKKGLAEILLLDRELFMLTKKAELAFPDATPRQSTDEGDFPNTPKSSASSRHDRTFITKNNASRSFSNATSPRTPANSKIAATTKKIEKNQEPVERGSDDDKDGTSTSLNKRLTEDQQKRVSELLQIDDSDLASHLPYLTSEETQLDAEVTERLKQYGHLDRLSEEDGGVVTYSEGKRRKIVTKIFTKDDGNDYLRQMREERKEKEYEKKIDSILSSLNQNTEADYRHFFDEDDRNEGDRKSVQSRSQYNQALHEVPLFSQVRLDVPIKRDDIDALVSGLKKQLSTTSTASSRPNTTSSLNSSSTLIIGDEDNHDVSTHLPSPSSSVQLAKREEIQQLLASLQTETQRLQLYRSKHLDGIKEGGSSSAVGEQEEEETHDLEEKDLEVAMERPFSPSDFELIPSYLRVQPPTGVTDSHSNQIQLRVPDSNREPLFPPIKASVILPEERRELGESSNPYAINRRIKAKQPSSTVHPESPRQARFHRFLSSRGSEPDVEASEEAGNYIYENNEDEEEAQFEVEGGDESDNDDIIAKKRNLVEKVRRFVEI